MDPRDVALISTLSQTNWELRTLWKNHQRYEQELEALKVLTPEDELRKKELQKKKLAGRDKIEAILAKEKASKPRRSSTPPEATA